MTYYLKYRSKTIDELDLDSVRLNLQKIITSGSIPHAFLFSGPKGSGKTSAARIIAKVLNCEKPDKKSGEPCNKCPSCISIDKGEFLDVIEIDAASHRGIDDIRTLRDAVKLAPAGGKKKVYIIDEAHMLTTEASNALLKTLEEPPGHVVFILATTNPEKLIETIKSRTVDIHFTKAKVNEIVRSLRRVSKGEKLKIEDEILEIIAKASDGSFRDAVKILEELVVAKIRFDKESITEYLYKKSEFEPDEFIRNLIEGNEKELFMQIENASNSGMSIENITHIILAKLKETLLVKVGVSEGEETNLSKSELTDLIGLISKSYAEISYAVLEQIPLELAVAEWIGKYRKEKGREVVSKEDLNIKASSNTSQKIGKIKAVESKAIKSFPNGENESISEFTQEVWMSVLEQIKPKNTSTEALLRAAKPLEFDGKVLKLGVYYKFHKERLETNPHIGLLESVVRDVTGGRNIRVICTLTDPPPRIESKNIDQVGTTSEEVILKEGEDDEIVRVAKEIFGN